MAIAKKEEGAPPGGFYGSMSRFPLPFLVVWPLILLVISYVGLTKDNLVEDEVGNIWVPTTGSYHKDKNYEDSVRDDFKGASAFLAISVSRDDGNLLTESRLREINDRMDSIMNTTVTHNGKTYKYADICYSNNFGLGTTYEFPCLRVTPMDLFAESQSGLSVYDKRTWYTKLFKDALINPLIPRFGVGQNDCASETNPALSALGVENTTCNTMFGLRLDDVTGDFLRSIYQFPASYADTLSLFSDIGNLEPAEPCYKCIENNLDATVEQIYQGVHALFGPDYSHPAIGTMPNGLLGMYYGSCASNVDLSSFGIFYDASYQATSNGTASLCAQKYAEVLQVTANGRLSRKDAKDFLFYATTRELYAALGAGGLVETWNNGTTQAGLAGTWGAAYSIAQANFRDYPFTHPDAATNATHPNHNDIDEDTAKEWLKAHADAPFSSVRVGGSPLPIYSENGIMFEIGAQSLSPQPISCTSPFGGSGLDLSGDTGSAGAYFVDKAGQLQLVGDNEWITKIEGDPMVKWFLAGVTPDTTNFVNNDDVPIAGSEPVVIQAGVPAMPANMGVVAAMNSAVPDAGDDFLDAMNAASFTGTQYKQPFEAADASGATTKQVLARHWYDLLIDSPAFLGVVEGVSNPYIWTTGQGCGLDFKGERPTFTGKTDAEILETASNFMYYIDEGVSIGAIDPNLVIGGSTPGPSAYNAFTDTLTEVKAFQHIFPALRPRGIVDRVKNCKRPDGAIDITEGEAEEVLLKWKEEFEDAWSAGWDDPNAGDVQFVGFFDDAGVVGTTGRMLEEITLGGGTLIIVSYAVTIVCSVIFLFSCNPITSKTALTFFGAILVILAFFSALGATSLVGISLNITMGWTLPFIMVGLGMDDMYIILLALKNNGGTDSTTFTQTMKEVLVPVTMTSMVNASMFAIMHMSDIPAVYQTATTALFAVAALYISMVTTFPAFCWMDMKRQAAGKKDWLCCLPGDDAKAATQAAGSIDQGLLYTKVYEPLMLTEGPMRTAIHIFVVGVTISVAALAGYGCTDFEIGVGIEDLFPGNSQGGQYATSRTEYLGSWPININWGDIDYTSGDIQMKMVDQFESVIQTAHVSDAQTEDLWIADFATWTTRYCTANFNPETLGVRECGKDQIFPEESTTCTGAFMENSRGLRNKIITFVTDYEAAEDCSPNSGGYCIQGDKMHSDDVADLENVERSPGSYEIGDSRSSWCPVAVDLDTTSGTYTSWSNAKFKWCVQKWRNYTGGKGNLEVVADTATAYEACAGDYLNDDEIKVNADGAIPVSSGPGFYGVGLQTHQDTVDLIKQTREFCDDDDEARCWMSGIAYDYWEQYVDIESFLFTIIVVGVAVGFLVATIFLVVDLTLRNEAGHSIGKILFASSVGGLLITIVTVLSVLTVVGLSTLLNVNLTAFSVMSYILSVGFAVEYSVHITHRFLTAPLMVKSASDRVAYAMDHLFLPCYMAFISSTVGIVCLVFSEFDFINVFFFRPLIVVMFATFFYGCFFLPVLLSKLNIDVLKVGPQVSRLSSVAQSADDTAKLAQDL